MQGSAKTVAGAACLDGAPLHLILQHAYANAQPVDLLNILLTSKLIKAAVLEACKGQIPVQFTKAKGAGEVLEFTSWLAKYGQLASSLTFQSHPLIQRNTRSPTCCEDEAEASEGESALAVALQQAAKSSKSAATRNSCSLQLQSCVLRGATTGISAVLQQLPALTLQSLDLNIQMPPVGTCSGIPWDANTLMTHSLQQQGGYLPPLSNSMMHLTNLRDLTLGISGNQQDTVVVLDPMLPHLSALTQLSRLEISCVTYEASFHLLPESLQELSLGDGMEDLHEPLAPYPLMLEHLTALTSLTATEGVGVIDGCVLPKSLVKLHVATIDSVHGTAILSSLKNLQVLSLTFRKTNTGGNLHSLTALSSLSLVELSYNMCCMSDQNAAGFSWQRLQYCLPLRSLYFILSRMERASVLQLGNLTKLTSLYLDTCTFQCSSTDLAAVLSTLTSLEWLVIEHDGNEGSRMFLEYPNPDPDTADGLVMLPFSLAKAMASLQNLQSLCLGNITIRKEAVQILACGVAGQLTTLQITDCSLDDYNLNVMLLHSSKLVELDVCGNDQVGDGVLPVVAKLPALTLLGHRGTGITEEGLALFLPHVVCTPCLWTSSG